MSQAETEAVELTLLVPAFNEEQNIASAVATNAATARELQVTHEILVINDGSFDGTGQLLLDLQNQYPALRVMEHEVNQGIGGAIRTGLRGARGEFCALFPADSPSTVETLQPFLSVRNHADLVLGYREEKPGYSWLMLLNSRFYHFLLRTFCGLSYRDMNWVHLYRRSIFEQINLEFSGIVMQAEVVLKAHALGLRIEEVPCPMQERTRGRASASRFKVMRRTGLDLLRLLWQWRGGVLRKNLGKGLLKHDLEEVTA